MSGIMPWLHWVEYSGTLPIRQREQVLPLIGNGSITEKIERNNNHSVHLQMKWWLIDYRQKGASTKSTKKAVVCTLSIHSWHVRLNYMQWQCHFRFSYCIIMTWPRITHESWAQLLFKDVSPPLGINLLQSTNQRRWRLPVDWTAIILKGTLNSQWSVINLNLGFSKWIRCFKEEFTDK